ncbi:MAG: hypothetical protein C5B57_13070 [Blastocatellia bacterium]|nr:MAG: hypothetical protein C5B57_13070 [Blastocatellia bacterium]
MQENTDGIDLQSGSWWNTVKENEFLNNRSRGIMIPGNTFDNAENSFSTSLTTSAEAFASKTTRRVARPQS